MNPTLILAVLALLVFVGLALEQLFRRTGIPDVLVLLGFGIVLNVTGLFDVRALNGLDTVFTTAALVLILFEGAIQLRLADLRSALGGVLRLTLLSFFIAMIVVAAVAVVFMGMRPLAGLLLGAILGGTSSAVVIPIVQTMKLERDTRTALTLESAFTDVLCIVAALALAGALAAGTVEVGAIGLQLGLGFVGALLVGGALGLLWAFGLKALRQHRASFLALGAAVFLVYAVAEALGTFGAIACLAFGVVLGNAPDLARGSTAAAGLELAPGERLFLGEVAFLLKLFFFVYLGASLQLGSWQPWVFGLIAAAAIFASRPIAVRFGLSRKATPRRDATVAAALAPRGLAAAVLASVPVQMGIAEGATIEAATVGTILFSITTTSALVFAIDAPFVRGLYERFFRSWPDVVAAGADAPPAIEAPQAEEQVVVALPQDAGAQAAAGTTGEAAQATEATAGTVAVAGDAAADAPAGGDVPRRESA